MQDDQSNINPLALVFLVVVGLIAVQGRRASAVKALLAIAAFLPLGQQVVVLGIHVQFFRILMLIGYFRVISRGETRNFVMTTVDRLFIAWAVTGFVCGFLRKPAGLFGDECLGRFMNSCGVYFLVRFLTPDPAEIVEHVRFLAFIAIIMALAMAWEFATHHNLFSVFGGVPEITLQRDDSDRFRCQGSFRHPILAGTFGASLFPLMVGLWLAGGRDRKLALVAVICCLFSAVVAASSGAVMTCATALIGLALWPMRDRMHLLRRGIVAALIVAALTMKQPVWYLIARVSDLVGGGGWHRSYLIDQFVNHWNEWWIIGSSYTAHWAPAGIVLVVDPNNMDITNHYIAQGLQGGLLRLGLFIAIIVSCFKIVGRAVRGDAEPPLPRRFLWAMGVTLCAHCTAFIAVSYFDQIEVFWFWLLAVIAAVPLQLVEEVAADRELEAGAGIHPDEVVEAAASN
jgi:hypothetical protein